MSDINERVRNARLEAGLTQQELATIAEVGLASVVRIEAGRQSPTIAMIQRLADAMDITISDILEETVA